MHKVVTSPDGKLSCSQLLVKMSLLTSITDCVFSGCFLCVLGYSGTQSLDAIVLLRKFIEGSCSAMMSMWCFASLPLLIRPCWQFGDLLRFCFQIASSLCSLFTVCSFMSYVGIGWELLALSSACLHTAHRICCRHCQPEVVAGQLSFLAHLLICQRSFLVLGYCLLCLGVCSACLLVGLAAVVPCGLGVGGCPRLGGLGIYPQRQFCLGVRSLSVFVCWEIY